MILIKTFLRTDLSFAAAAAAAEKAAAVEIPAAFVAVETLVAFVAVETPAAAEVETAVAEILFVEAAVGQTFAAAAAD